MPPAAAGSSVAFGEREVQLEKGSDPTEAS